MTAIFDIEAAFVGQFAAATTSKADHPAVNETMGLVAPEMLEDRELAAFYDILRVRFSEGEPTDTADILADLRAARVEDDARQAVMGNAFTAGQLGWYTARILSMHRSRRQVELLRLALPEAERALSAGGDKARKIAERLSTRLLEVFADTGSGQAQNLADMLADEREAMTRESDIEIPVPFPKLNHVFGPLVPGDVVGLSAFSGGGKSTVAANLAAGWIDRGIPVLAFPTEMRQRWVARLTALRSGTRQWIAEKRQWGKATDEERLAYREATLDLGGRMLEIVNRPDISPAEIVTATRILRKRWAGRPVVVIVDHMHRLNYGGEDPNDAVGPATKLLKDFASDDKDGGLVFLCLFQPRKPGSQDNAHRAVAAAEIRGNSMVWNELDVHVSPFRPWVKASEYGQTAWGTPRCALDPAGMPVLVKPDSDGSKLDDEHVYFKVDKRRIGGDFGGVISLEFAQPSGLIYEVAPEPDRAETAA